MRGPKQRYKTNIVIDVVVRQLLVPCVHAARRHVLCVICCTSGVDIKYIDCGRRGVVNVPFGRGKACCKDKPICLTCRRACACCPFCRTHNLLQAKGIRMRKHKKPFVDREIDRKRRKERRERLKSIRNERDDAPAILQAK